MQAVDAEPASKIGNRFGTYWVAYATTTGWRARRGQNAVDTTQRARLRNGYAGEPYRRWGLGLFIFVNLEIPCIHLPSPDPSIEGPFH